VKKKRFLAKSKKGTENRFHGGDSEERSRSPTWIGTFFVEKGGLPKRLKVV
jgi:hypothetical protein